MTQCPECKKQNAYLVTGKKVVCRNCGYDERFDVISSKAGKLIKKELS